MMNHKEALELILKIGQSDGRTVYEAASFMADIAAYALNDTTDLDHSEWTYEEFLEQTKIRFKI